MKLIRYAHHQGEDIWAETFMHDTVPRQLIVFLHTRTHFWKQHWVTAFIGHKRLNPNLFNDCSRNYCLLFASDTLGHVCCSKTTVRCCPLVVKKKVRLLHLNGFLLKRRK